MLRLVNGRLVWHAADTMLMSQILNEGAAHQRVPYQEQVAIIKVAARLGVAISPSLQRRLAKAEAFRRQHRALRRAGDAPARSARERRFFAHQRADLAYIAATQLPAYLLAHEPGVGKTLVAIRWASVLCGARRILVVTPGSAKTQWRRAIQTWAPRRQRDVTIVEGTIAEQTRAATTERGWVVAHWESLVHARDGYLAKSWDAVILDEVHNIQNLEAKRTMTALDLVADHRMALTAHPFTNSETELFPILRFLYPKTYTSFWRFVAMHIKVQPKPFGGVEFVGARRPKTLRWELEPFYLRRTKREVFTNLPPIVRITRTVELSPKGRREYERLKKEFFAELETLDPETPRVLAIPSVLARITRLRQYLIDPGLLGASEPSVKYPIVLELLDEMNGPPVIFTQFREAAIRLNRFLGSTRRRRFGRIIAGAASKRDKQQRATYQEEFLAGKLDYLIVLTQVGGTALNLGKYGYVIHLDLPWNPRDLEQTEGRVDRPEEGTGALVPTTAFPIIVANSYEERNIKRIENKQDRFTRIFTPKDLIRLFS